METKPAVKTATLREYHEVFDRLPKIEQRNIIFAHHYGVELAGQFAQENLLDAAIQAELERRKAEATHV